MIILLGYITPSSKLIFVILLILSNTSMCQPPPPPPPGTAGVPHCGLSYEININKSEQFRDEMFEVRFILNNKERNCPISDIIVFGKFKDDFEVVGVSHHKEMSWDHEHFKINCSLGEEETRKFIYYIYTKKDADIDRAGIIDRSYIKINKYNEDGYDGGIYDHGINIVYKKNDVRLELVRENCVLNDKTNIKNNIPKIINSSATIISNLNPLPNNGSLLFKYKDEELNVGLRLSVSGIDKEDDNLTYTWIINPIGMLFSTNNKSNLITLPSQNSSVEYSFSVYAKDIDLDTSNTVSTKVIFRNNSYNSFVITNAEIEDKIKSRFIILVFIILLLSVVFKYRPKNEPYMDRLLDNTNKLRYLTLLIPIILYIISSYIAHKNYYWNRELPFYLTSLAWFEIIIYMIVFIFIILFTHNCFSQHEVEKDKFTATLWIVNLIGMTILLVSMTLIIPLIEPTLNIVEHLQWYYSTMAQVFASILAIVAVFYTALPNKNIISINLKEEKVEYNHPLILRRFIIIYGVILGLVLLGLSSGVYIEFPTYIKFSTSDLPNIFSIILFETTLLMIPPAISSLYTLIRITAFTGTAKIRSRPSASRIYLNGYETKLITPAKLMLREGDYDLSFMINKSKVRMFNWNEVPGCHIKLLEEFLLYRFRVYWVKTAKVEKTDNMVIKIYTDKNYLFLKLNNSKTIANLEIDDGRTYKLLAKMEKGALNVYYNKNVKLSIIPGTEKEYHLDILKLEQDNSDNSDIRDYLVSSKSFK